VIKYLLRRAGTACLQLLLITLIAYLLFYVVASATGADPARRVAGRAATPERVAEVAHVLGTDLPWYQQYFSFIVKLAHGDLGYSFMQRRPVSDIIFPAAPVTLSLLAGAALLWVLIAIPVGLVGALWPRSFSDRLLAILIQVAISAPVFWVAPMFSYLLAYQPSQGTFLGIHLGRAIQWLPIQGYVKLGAAPGEWVRHLLLPWLAFAVGYAALYARFVRALVSEQLTENYVLVARAKGASEARILGSHVGRIVSPSIVTMLGLDVGAMMGGALFVEQAFGLPGLGYVAYSSIQSMDYPLTMGTITFAALMSVALNTVADLVQGFLDPRVRR
jgi:peptide/nickel transport system permease protein